MCWWQWCDWWWLLLRSWKQQKVIHPRPNIVCVKTKPVDLNRVCELLNTTLNPCRLNENYSDAEDNGNDMCRIWNSCEGHPALECWWGKRKIYWLSSPGLNGHILAFSFRSCVVSFRFVFFKDWDKLITCFLIIHFYSQKTSVIPSLWWMTVLLSVYEVRIILHLSPDNPRVKGATWIHGIYHKTGPYNFHGDFIWA